MEIVSKRRRNPWRKKIILETKKQIKTQLDTLYDPKDPSVRLNFALSCIKDLESDFGAKAQLKRYVYIVSALVHHERYGGLSTKQVQRLFDLAYATLRVQGIRPGSSKLGSLYGDLHLVISQIYRRDGQHWEAAWEQQVSLYLSQRAPTGGKGFQSFALAIRALRLGHADFALDELDRSLQQGLPDNIKARAILEKIKAFRLSGNPEKAEAFSLKEFQELSPNKDELQEFHWEALCRQVCESAKVDSIVRAVQKGKSHHDYTYLCEAFLWSRVVQTREYLERFPTVRSLARDPHLKTKKKGFFSQTLNVIEELYDHSIPHALKIKKIGKILAQTHMHLNIELELLVWAAVARWLFRNRSHGFASLVLHEYQARSLKLSKGKNEDVLGVVADLLGKNEEKHLTLLKTA